MKKKITLILLLSWILVSCGKKGPPEYIDPEKKAKIENILIVQA